jgi:hypothetical protein
MGVYLFCDPAELDAIGAMFCQLNELLPQEDGETGYTPDIRFPDGVASPLNEYKRLGATKHDIVWVTRKPIPPEAERTAWQKEAFAAATHILQIDTNYTIGGRNATARNS